MKKQLLLSTLLGVATVFSMAQGAFAISQDVTGVLATTKTVVVKSGQVVSANIDAGTGALSAALTPGFTISANTAGGTLSVTATVDAATTTGMNALVETTAGTAPGFYIALANTTTKPADTAVADALILAADPTAATNANVVAYSIPAESAFTNLTGDLDATFAYSSNSFTCTPTGTGTGNVITTTATAARTNTHSIDDTAGNYVGHVLLSYT